MPEGIFDPLDYRNVAASVVSALLARPVGPLPPPEPFRGGGVYAIYYRGNFPAYRAIKKADTPIYVGKAVPKGGRIGTSTVGEDLDSLAMLEPDPGQSLLKRLRDHAKSITEAENLELSEFECRYLAVTPIWIVVAEGVLIQKFRPAWNVFVNGFGNHHVGTTRFGQKRTEWDTVHPGRSWATTMQPCAMTKEQILARVMAATQ